MCVCNTLGGICPAPPNPIDGDCGMVIQPPDFRSIEAGAVAIYGCPIGCVLNTTMIERTCDLVNMIFGEWSGVTPTCNRKFLYIIVSTYSSLTVTVIGPAKQDRQCMSYTRL